jgi:hypothetical protein
MKIFRFGSPTTAEPNDRDCLADLGATLDEAAKAISQQSALVQERYNRACCDAACALEDLENGGSPRLSRRVDQLTLSIDRDNKRLARLAEQAFVVARLQAVMADCIHPPLSGRNDNQRQAVTFG